jgi:hypothetical protein
MSEYDDFVRMSRSVEEGLHHILDADDVATVEGVVNALAVVLGEDPARWHGAGNVALMVAEALIGPAGPWTTSPVELRANTVITCFILTRLMAHPMMQPIVKSWEQEYNNNRREQK